MNNNNKTENKGKVWLIDVNMGYGHQRTAHPLKFLAMGEKIIHANDYEEIPEKDKKIWDTSRKMYEAISRMKKIPLLGSIVFGIMDLLQKIPEFYPKKIRTKPTNQLRQAVRFMKRGWGKHLIKKFQENPLPILSTFFTPAQMAEFFEYPGEIFCIATDADISRTWAPYKPQKSKIKYFTPNNWTFNRLKTYGVKEENLFLTGYPLPKENIGTEKMEILKKDLGERLVMLDPQNKYLPIYKTLIKEHLGKLPEKPNRPLTILFGVGGAGAQKEIGIEIVNSLKESVKTGKIKFILSAGIRAKVKDYFIQNIQRIGIESYLGKNLKVIFSENIEDYFNDFNLTLRTTDILWTKPSELSFYSGLGLPIIIAPPVGSQEIFNRKWLLSLGSGIIQENPAHSHEWLFDLLNSGRFARAAMQGFIEAETMGAFKIEKIIFNKK